MYLYTLDYDDTANHQSSMTDGSEPVDTPECTPGADSVSGDESLVSGSGSDSESSNAKSGIVESTTIISIDATTSSRLMINAQVYAMAEKFDIPPLKLLSREKFSNHARGWPISNFAGIVHEVLTSTPQSDRGLRDIVRDIITVHVTEITTASRKAGEHHQLLEVLGGEGEFSVDVLRETAKYILGLQVDQADLLKEAKKLAKEKVACEATKNSIVQRGGQILKEINDRDSCRSRTHKFRPKLTGLEQPNDWVANGVLECKECKTVHPFHPPSLFSWSS